MKICFARLVFTFAALSTVSGNYCDFNKCFECATPRGPVTNQEFCFYAVDVGNPNDTFVLLHNGLPMNDEVSYPVTTSLRGFCVLNDGFAKALTYRFYHFDNGTTRAELVNAYAYCCRENCAEPFKSGDENNINLMLAQTYIQKILRDALRREEPKTTQYIPSPTTPETLRDPILHDCYTMLAQGEEGKQKRCAGEAGCYATRYAALNDSRNDHLPQGCVSDLKDLEVDKKLQKLAPEHQRALLMCQDEKLWDKCFYVSLEEPGNPLLICCCTKNDMNKTSCKYLHRTRMYGHALDH